MEEKDPVKEYIREILQTMEGRVGDGIVFAALLMSAIAIKKKMYRVSVGFFILALGMVLVRFTIGLLF